jgi:hypothetical protein
MDFKGHLIEGSIGGLIGLSGIGLIAVGLDRGVDTASIMALIGAFLGSAVTVALAAGLSERKERSARARETNEARSCVNAIGRHVAGADIDKYPKDEDWNELVGYGARLREVLRLEYPMIQEALDHAKMLTLSERAGLRSVLRAADQFELIYDEPEPHTPEEHRDWLALLTSRARQVRQATQAAIYALR